MSEPPIEIPPVPIIQALAQESDGLVLAYGAFSSAPADPEHVVVDIHDPDEAAKLHQPGSKHVTPEGLITVTPPSPLPIQQTAMTTVRAQVHTTNDTPTEIWRHTTQPSHVYAVTLTYLGVNPSFAVFETSYRYVWRRGATGGAIKVGEAPLTEIPESATVDWNVQMRVSGNDAIFEVIGERTGPGDWLAYGDIGVYAPGGLTE
jgi:hypothetical protein